eukprot:TRINITY_DN7023_c0_g1_i1.p1 TRINITY_DN7023_c0_g1~~TRINITY_DN7023_c0_g1_i1.p1  ORF type:complete len:291 (+),score=64.57 TRINITY_DN7023_c0_g1_i1:17-889(+)
MSYQSGARRLARQRKEYLYQRSLEGAKREEYDRKRRVQQALDQGTAIPNELRADAAKLEESLAFEDMTSMNRDTRDSEYARAGTYDPKVMITTSRDPSSKLLQFVKEMKLLFPDSERMLRGAHIIGDLVNGCRVNGFSDLIIVHETRGQPDAMIVSHLPYGPTAHFSLSNVITRHDIGGMDTMSTQNPHLIFDGFTTHIGERVKMMLKYLFPAAKEDSNRVMTFANNDDFISFRHHIYQTEGKRVNLSEIGPRFEMRLYKLVLGTIDAPEAEVEWALRNYQNTSRKRNVL